MEADELFGDDVEVGVVAAVDGEAGVTLSCGGG